ncbi:hypothetical protein LY78DRAFT_221712 [Colletotrichum sublineola]|nr:hypothetical protein LY78DRAFT_221712 [Colletotrichum sublineola]
MVCWRGTNIVGSWALKLASVSIPMVGIRDVLTRLVNGMEMDAAQSKYSFGSRALRGDPNVRVPGSVSLLGARRLVRCHGRPRDRRRCDAIWHGPSSQDSPMRDREVKERMETTQNRHVSLMSRSTSRGSISIRLGKHARGAVWLGIPRKKMPRATRRCGRAAGHINRCSFVQVKVHNCWHRLPRKGIEPLAVGKKKVTMSKARVVDEWFGKEGIKSTRRFARTGNGIRHRRTGEAAGKIRQASRQQKA